MNENDPFAQIFRDTPRFEVPPVSNVRLGAVRGGDPFAQVFSDTPLFEAPHDLMFDSDADGVIDPWDCQPFNPEEDGWFGDAWRRVTSRVRQATRVDYGRAAARRSSVRRTVRRAASRASGRAASTRRSVRRRIAPVTRRVRSAVARAPIHVSRERAAERRATVRRAVATKVAPVTAAVRAAAARAPVHVSRERAAERRAAVVSGISAFAAKMSPIGVAAAAPGEPDKPGEARQRMIDSGVLKDRPTTITTGVGGVPGQPDRAGDVHAYVGVPTTAPGYRGEDAPGERSSFWGMDFGLAAERRGEIFGGGVWGAPKQILAGISDLGAQPREKFESHVEAATARQQAKFQPGTLSDLTTGFSEKMSRVAKVARGFESEAQVAYVPDVMQKYLGAPAQFTVPSVKSLVHGTEEKLGLHAEWIPAPLKTAGWAAKEAVYGAAFSGTAGAVEMVGMVPVAFEAMAKRPEIIPAAVGVGLVTMGKGMWHGATTSPTRLMGEFATFGALMKGGGRVIDPLTPKIIRGEGYVGVGIKGRTKATYKTVDVLATPKEFLKSEMKAGRIKGVQHKQFSPEVYAAEGVVPHKAWGSIHHPSVGQKWFPSEIYVSPKTYINTFMRPLRVAKAKQYFKPHKRDIPMKLDVFAERLVRKSHPTHSETLAHELFHYTRPKATEGAILKMERIYAEAPSQKVFTIPKQVKVGYTYTPKPIIGIRTGKFTTPEGVTTTYKGIQVGKSWTPAELTKTYKMESVTGAEGTALAMEKLTQARLGQLRYEHSGFARGKIDPGYFLPEAAKASPKGMPELMTAEKGLVPTGRMLPSVDVIKPPSPPKPTRLYAEISQPYMKAVDAPLAGSPAHIRWVEAGFRKVSYGVKGAPGVKGGKQVRFEVEAEPWGYHPTFPPSIAGGTAVVPSYLPGGYAPKQISTGGYFHPEGAPSSRFYDVAHAERPTAPKPAPTPQITPLKTITPSEPLMPPRPPAARPAPVIEPVQAAGPMRALAPEPAAPVAPGAMVADTVRSPVLEALFGDMKAAESMQTGASCPIFAPSGTPSRPIGTTGAAAPAKEGWWAPETKAPSGKAPTRPRTVSEMLARTRVPVVVPVPMTGRRTETAHEPEYADVGSRTLTPWYVPEFTPAPVEGEKEDERRRWFIMPRPGTEHELEPRPDQRTDIDTYTDPYPTPTPNTDTDTTTDDDPVPDTVPDEWRPPPTPPNDVIVDDPPPVPTPKKLPKDKKKEKRRKLKPRGPFDWYLEHEMMTLEGFLGGAAKPASGAFPEPDLGSPVAVKRAGGKRAKSPGLLDVPPGW